MWYRINIDGVCKFVDSARYKDFTKIPYKGEDNE